MSDNRRDPADQRKFSTTFTKPVRVRLDHDGKTVFDQTLEGEVEIMLGDHCPATGTTTIFFNDEPVAEVQCPG